MAIRTVGVVGCGLMGSGIAQVCAAAGYRTRVREVEQKLLDRGLAGIEKSLAKLVEKGKLSADQKSAAQQRLEPTLELADLKDCDLVIEAITENLELKRSIYATLESLCGPETIFATNTSSLSVTELMVGSKRPERFLGLHFFNPVPIMKLVEVVRTVASDAAVVDQLVAFAESLGKAPIRCQDRSGFIVNRLLVPYLLDAVRALEEGVGSKEDIDRGMELGCGYPMGPLKLLDFVGLDTTLYIAEIMFQEYREKRFAPPPLLKRMVLAGYNGRKAGRGFYDYSS
ncbi:MAG TPA: 3-hydroxybutyryl-CoA dehydrogenase [Acidobacteriota bacterium]|jgi:3-hydroxybutyryl-CoA dehydrogenase